MRNRNYEYRIIHFFSLLFAVYMVGLGLFVDFSPEWYMNLWEKLIIYFSPMLLLFMDMKLHLRKLEEEEEKRTIQYKTMRRIFTIYVIALATLLFLGSTFRGGIYHRNIWNAKPFSQDHFDYYCNLHLMKSVKMYYHAFQDGSMSLKLIALNLLGNLIAFAPFGFFLPVTFGKKIRNVGQFLLAVTFASVLCELIQFITMVGQGDIDDVLLNVLGALIIYLLVHIPIVRELIRKVLPYGDF